MGIDVNESIKAEKIAKIESHMKEVLNILGVLSTKDNEKTPYRVAKMYVDDFFRNYSPSNKIPDDFLKSMTTFANPNVGETNELKITDIPFHSICEHHLLPFFGKMSITYVPGFDILGLSKFHRVVDYFSHMPQTQEKLGKQIGEFLFNILDEPRYIEVSIEAVHTCVTCRGIESSGSFKTVWKKRSTVQD